jgi:predicted component of type VI protein secretion system
MSQFNGNAADLDINFERNIFTNDVVLKTGEEAIRRAVKSLVLLKSNEKPFHPEINAGITDLLFENADPIAVEEIKRRIRQVILRFEPRIMDLTVDMEYNIDKNYVNVKILYTIRNVRQVFTTSLALQRTR